MRTFVLCGIAFAVELAACAQAPVASVPPSRPVQQTASAPRPNVDLGPKTLGGHLLPGAKIFDSTGKWVGLFGGFNDNGTLNLWVIPENERQVARLRAGAQVNTRVLPASSVRWDGKRLLLGMTADAIGTLPTRNG